MARHALSSWGWWCLFSAVSIGAAGRVHGAALDERGEINLGVRTYTAVRNLPFSASGVNLA